MHQASASWLALVLALIGGFAGPSVGQARAAEAYQVSGLLAARAEVPDLAAWWGLVTLQIVEPGASDAAIAELLPVAVPVAMAAEVQAIPLGDLITCTVSSDPAFGRRLEAIISVRAPASVVDPGPLPTLDNVADRATAFALDQITGGQADPSQSEPADAPPATGPDGDPDEAELLALAQAIADLEAAEVTDADTPATSLAPAEAAEPSAAAPSSMPTLTPAQRARLQALTPAVGGDEVVAIVLAVEPQRTLVAIRSGQLAVGAARTAAQDVVAIAASDGAFAIVVGLAAIEPGAQVLLYQAATP